MKFKSDSQRRAIFAKFNRFSERSDDKVDVKHDWYEWRINPPKSLLEVVNTNPEPSIEDFNRDITLVNDRILSRPIVSDEKLRNELDAALELKLEKKLINDLDDWRRKSFTEERHNSRYIADLERWRKEALKEESDHLGPKRMNDWVNFIETPSNSVAKGFNKMLIG